MVYSSFLLIIISVLFSLFLFQFLDSPSQKITMRDFHLHQQFNVFVCLLFIFFYFIFLLFCVCVCVCGGGGGGDVVTKRDLNLDTKNSWFFRGPISMYFKWLAFYLIFLWRLIYMFDFILLSSLQYFLSLDELVTWSRAFCSLWVHLVTTSLTCQPD